MINIQKVLALLLIISAIPLSAVARPSPETAEFEILTAGARKIRKSVWSADVPSDAALNKAVEIYFLGLSSFARELDLKGEQKNWVDCVLKAIAHSKDRNVMDRLVIEAVNSTRRQLIEFAGKGAVAKLDKQLDMFAMQSSSTRDDDREVSATRGVALQILEREKRQTQMSPFEQFEEFGDFYPSEIIPVRQFDAPVFAPSSSDRKQMISSVKLL